MKRIREAIENRLHSIQDNAFNRINLAPDEIKIAQQQIDDMLEFFWVCVPWSEDSSYVDARTQLESLMAARKTTRNFQAVTWGAMTPKSSLDGIRESVIPETAYPDRYDSDEVRSRKIQTLFRRYGAGPAERMSGVDLLKRHGQRGPESRFPSTSHMAALPLLEHIRQNPAAQSAWEAYAKALPDTLTKQARIPDRFVNSTVIPVDGSLFFESRIASLVTEYAQTETTMTDKQTKDKIFTIKGALAQFLRQATNKEAPIPYYCILLADGDGIGSVIDAQKSPEDHRKLSNQLNQFSLQVRTTVEGTHNGALIYAGGDDVMALLPLHTVLACARTLSEMFRQQMAQFSDAEKKSPTFSVGIAVSHHLDPLDDALALARNAESAAKSVPNKDALAISVDMRSGTTRTIKGKWGQIDQIIDQFIQFHRADAVPDGAAYQLRDTALRLGGDQTLTQNSTLRTVMALEGNRILSRKKADHGTR